MRGLIKDGTEIIERERFGEHAEAPIGDESAKRDAGERHDHAHEQPEAEQPDGEPFPLAERQLANAAGLAFDRRVLARVLQQLALQQDERKRHRHDADRNCGHQVIRRRPELVGELIEVRRQHEMPLGIAKTSGRPNSSMPRKIRARPRTTAPA
jgi:hypothetical protein